MGTSENSEDRRLSVVLSGGGCMTFWSLGALERIRPILPPVTEWAGVSAGSAMASACLANRVDRTLEKFCARTAANRSNFYPLRLLGKRPAFPHEPIYRATILDALAEGGFETLRAGAPLRILLARFAPGAPVVRTILGAVRAYRRRKRRHVLHGPDTPYPGFEIHVATAQDCDSAEELCDLILASSCTPPITGVQTIDGRRHADGALVDHAPVRALSAEARQGRILVFSTMCIPRPSLPSVPGRFYLTPSRPTPIAIWDYASPQLVRETFELGQQDAKRLLGPVEEFLETAPPD